MRLDHVLAVGLALAALVATAERPLGAQAATAPAGAASLDFEYFKTKVQPIFIARRPGHARCVACHIDGTPMRFQPLPAGAANWSDEDSRKNFQVVVQRAVSAGNPRSKLLVHPLLESAGGDFYHNGGKHWRSQDDPEFQTLKAWVMGATVR